MSAPPKPDVRSVAASSGGAFRVRTRARSALLVFLALECMALDSLAAAPWNSSSSISAGVAAAADTAAAGEPPADEQASPLEIEGYGSVRLETSDAAGIPTSFALRRLVLETDARPVKGLRFHTEIELERLGKLGLERSAARDGRGLAFKQAVEGSSGSELAIEQAWGQYELLPVLAIRFGAVLPPVGRLNRDHDDFESDFPRRPLIDREIAVLPAPAAWTELGLGVVGGVGVGTRGSLAWEVYALNGTTLAFGLEQTVELGPAGVPAVVVETSVAPRAGAFDGSGHAGAVAGRLRFRPGPATEIAVSGYRGRYTPDYLDRTAAVGTVGLDGRQRLGPVRLEGEALFTHYDRLQRTLLDLAGRVGRTTGSTGVFPSGAVATRVELTASGLSRRRYGFWVDASMPLRIGSADGRLDGPSLAPIVRYERVWLSGDISDLALSESTAPVVSARDRQQSRLSVGLAFRPHPKVVAQLVYERNAALVGTMIAPEVGARTTNGIVFGMAFGF